MLKKYRNSLLDMIRAANLDPRRFTPQEEEIDGYQAFRLRVEGSPLYFTTFTRFGGEDREFKSKWSKYVRGHPKPTYLEYEMRLWSKFKPLQDSFKEWLDTSARKYLSDRDEEIEDLMITDLWAELDIPSGSTDDSQSLQNTPFSNEEHIRIAAALRELEEEVQRQGGLTTEQANLLHEQVEYLVESSKRLGRKDWLVATAGALIGFTIQAGLTSDAATQIIRLAGEALRWIAHKPLLLS
jgi:hypothetical protein